MERTGIRDSACATALVGILQLAKAHPQGFAGSIAHSVNGAWFTANVDILFQDNGPLGTFNPIRPQMLMGHFGVAMHQAKDYFNQGHSSKQSGVGKEAIPVWACHFFWFFNAMESTPSASAQATELATNRHIVVNSIMGQQAPLGPHQVDQHVQLRTKTEE
jgi:hypothetical protein